MELLERKHLKEAASQMSSDINDVRTDVLELKRMLYRLVEAPKEKDPLVVDKAEAMRLLGGISTFKLREIEASGLLESIKLGDNGHNRYRVCDLEKLIGIPFKAI